MTARPTFAPLVPGALIGVVAPAGPAAPEALAALPALYARYGHRARLFPGCHARCGDLAGDDALRLADLHAALADPDVRAIHALRGGYGAMRLLEGVDTRLTKANPKPLIGYSDVTALHALWVREGLPVLHAPMPSSDLLRPGRDGDAAALFALLADGLPVGTVLRPALDPAPRSAGVHAGGRATGVLIGGNLSLVAALVGTPWAWVPHGAILLLEDVDEAPYRVDRLLMQLRLAGVLDALAGFVVGSFTGAAPPWRELRETLVLPHCARQGKPLLAGWPVGHGTPNRPLPLGVRVALDADDGTLTMLDPAPS